jgi:hypothetical protein
MLKQKKVEVERLSAENTAMLKAITDYIEAQKGGFLAHPIECSRVFQKAISVSEDLNAVS